ncbi:DUF6233 domain-containing protein [Streptomyces sp. NPDC048565]|uniref:DUF6233 domain-containing protein n=1 Tax=Streptomyces sp. NPDC048565 TaxID=3155266 RepID=UPI00342BF55B
MRMSTRAQELVTGRVGWSGSTPRLHPGTRGLRGAGAPAPGGCACGAEVEDPALAVARDRAAASRNCTLYLTDAGYVSREDAMIALAEPDIRPCEICGPETALRSGLALAVLKIGSEPGALGAVLGASVVPQILLLGSHPLWRSSPAGRHGRG